MLGVAAAAPVRSRAHSCGVAKLPGADLELTLLADKGVRKRSRCIATARRCLSNVERKMLAVNNFKNSCMSTAIVVDERLRPLHKVLPYAFFKFSYGAC